MRKAKKRLASMLRDVGTGDARTKSLEFSLHLKRKLSAAEILLLQPEWLALPAIDKA